MADSVSLDTMPRTTLLTFLAGVTSIALHGQEMVLGPGSLTISSGTTLRLEGPIHFSWSSGSTVRNDGLIDLGSEAHLSEPSGAPIIGDGNELAVIGMAPFTGIEPGGLGLTLSTVGGNAPFSLERWHSTLHFPEGDPSIARWYRFSDDIQGPGTLDVSLRFDPTELNGLEAASLALHVAGTENGPWTEISSTVDEAARSIAGAYSAPWNVLAAFDADAPTAVPDLAEVTGFRAWPTLVTTIMYVAPTTDNPINTLEVFDAAGRRTPIQADLSKGWASVGTEAIAPGAYYLRINGIAVIKFRKV